MTRARAILQSLQEGQPIQKKVVVREETDQLSMLDMGSEEIRQRLEGITVETLTPIEAMNILYELKQML